MQSQRTTRFLARLVLAWFVLCLGAAAAASVVQPQGLQLVCSGSSFKLLPAGDDDATLRVGLDCPLCSPAVVPPPALVTFAPAPARHGPVLPAATLVATQQPACMPPARGPPAAA